MNNSRTKELNSHYLATTISLLVSGALLAACGSGSSTTSSASVSSTATTHAVIQTRTPGTLTIAYRSDDKPASYISNGHAAGYEIDLMKAVAAQMHLKTKFIDIAFNGILPGVQNKQFDTSIGVLATPAREKQVGFSTPTDYVYGQLISKKSDPLATVNDAAGHSVAITAGSALIPLLQNKVPTVTIKQFPAIAASANALEIGQVQGLFTGPLTTTQLLKQYPNLEATQQIPIAFDAFPYPKDDTSLGTAIDAALKSVMENGTFTKIFEKSEPGKQIPKELLAKYPGMPQATSNSSSTTSAG